MQYPFSEKIGDPSLLVGREREWKNFGKWLRYIPKKLAKSRVILARRKSGKTAFVQRIRGKLWSENGAVIPFYFDIAENPIWYPDLAIDYYCAFASQYISFLERDRKPQAAKDWFPNGFLCQKSRNTGLQNQSNPLSEM